MQRELSGLGTKVANIGKDESSQIKDLKIVKSGYTVYKKYGKKYYFATYGACVKNPNKNYETNYAVFKDGKGKIIDGASNDDAGDLPKKVERDLRIPQKIEKKVSSCEVYAYPNIARM